jgi:hypothetical protein
MEKEVSRDTRFDETKSAALRMNRCLHELVGDHPDFELLCEPTRAPYYFRYVPHTLAERLDEIEIQQLVDRLNENIVENVQCRGFHSVMTINVRGLVAIQISISSNEIPHTTFEALARWGRLLHSTYQSTSDMETELCSSELHSSPTELSAT